MENPIKMDDLGGPPLFLETPMHSLQMSSILFESINPASGRVSPRCWVGMNTLIFPPLILDLGADIWIYMAYVHRCGSNSAALQEILRKRNMHNMSDVAYLYCQIVVFVWNMIFRTRGNPRQQGNHLAEQRYQSMGAWPGWFFLIPYLRYFAKEKGRCRSHRRGGWLAAAEEALSNCAMRHVAWLRMHSLLSMHLRFFSASNFSVRNALYVQWHKMVLLYATKKLGGAAIVKSLEFSLWWLDECSWCTKAMLILWR